VSTQLTIQLFDLDGFAPAEFSPCHLYRYILARRWSPAPLLGCVGLNPSTADEANNDPTVRRWCGFARRDGYGGIVVGNLYGWRSTSPRALLTVSDPIGDGDDSALERIAIGCAAVLTSWGALPSRRMESRACDVLRLLRERAKTVGNLGLTKSGQPRHPLYLRSDEPMRMWPALPPAGERRDHDQFPNS
jgi:hypothetical protein